MDALKLLSRSTRISRRRDPSRVPSVTPSEGSVAQPQLFGHDSTKPDGQPPLKKRRQEPPVEESDEAELDFFGAPAQMPPKKREGRIMAASKGDLTTHAVDAEKGNATTATAPDLSEEECRRVLKKHKLRITQLWAPKVATAAARNGKEEKTKRRKSDLDKTEDSNGDRRAQDVICQPLQAFAQLQSQYAVPRRLANNLDQLAYTTPTEVQMAALPMLLKSSESTRSRGPDVDLLSVAPTGSGKTLAFLIPTITSILQRRREQEELERAFGGPQAVILAPTKELAGQTVNECRKLVQNTGLRVSLVRKGMRIACDEEGRAAEADGSEVSGDPVDVLPPVKSHILVATPGVFQSCLAPSANDDASYASKLHTVRHLILDEADVLLDPLFREQTLAAFAALSNHHLRTSFWSATMGASVESLVTSLLRERYHTLGVPAQDQRPLLRLVVGLKDVALPTISHKLIYCASETGKLLALRNLLHPTSTSNSDEARLRPPFLVFTQTIPRAVALHSELLYDIPTSAGGPARIAVLHAELSDKQRDSVMTRFRRGEIWVLITTDLLSRGVDFRGVNGVVNYDFPASSAIYIHRVGRTGRAGREGGVAVTLYAKDDVPVLGVVANVVAASEKLRDSQGSSRSADKMDRWLMELLPKVGKRSRQKLKREGGIASRKQSAKDARISTKSGYQRRLEERRKGAVQKTRGISQAAGAGSGDDGSDEDEFVGTSE